jgi:hypothetical protein
VIHEHGEPWWNDIDRVILLPDLSTIAPQQSYQQTHLVAKQEELAKEIINSSL